MPEADYEYLIENFGEEKILNRFVFIRDRAIDFLNRICKDHEINFDDYFFVSDELIEEAVIDYFADLVRLKDFHDIEKAQPQKVAAYTSYWVFRRKPIQLKKPIEDDLLISFPNIKFLNESFAYTLLINLVFDERKRINDSNPRYGIFRDLIMYNFQYRQLNSQILELVIVALSTNPNKEFLSENDHPITGD
ncbi:hypothetical protein EHQ47_03840 [Leptospira bourretii]|uniref:hypothetical protein n=1 Tax=Leptospira bourretii TaxID=2484962 RepID=UPI001090AF71|nr:hypothetical protein [Leptospira bourretii]TGL25076.1 hypothetical protein EHQ47_03840 [Leptospira bourretii]